MQVCRCLSGSANKVIQLLNFRSKSPTSTVTMLSSGLIAMAMVAGVLAAPQGVPDRDSTHSTVTSASTAVPDPDSGIGNMFNATTTLTYLTFHTGHGPVVTQSTSPTPVSLSLKPSLGVPSSRSINTTQSHGIPVPITSPAANETPTQTRKPLPVSSTSQVTPDCSRIEHGSYLPRGTASAQSSTETSAEDDFQVNVTISGHKYPGGENFTTSGSYHGNCTDGILNRPMGPSHVSIYDSCSTSVCYVGKFMAWIGTLVTAMMQNPQPIAGNEPAWCKMPENATKTGMLVMTASRSSSWPALETGRNVTRTITPTPIASWNGEGWPALETGRWNTTTVSSGTVSPKTTTPMGTPMIPSHASSISTATLETSPRSKPSISLSSIKAPTSAEPMVTDTLAGYPTLSGIPS